MELSYVGTKEMYGTVNGKVNQFQRIHVLLCTTPAARTQLECASEWHGHLLCSHLVINDTTKSRCDHMTYHSQVTLNQLSAGELYSSIGLSVCIYNHN